MRFREMEKVSVYRPIATTPRKAKDSFARV